MKVKTTSIILLSMCFFQLLQAQYQANYWYFGLGAEMDFTTLPPTSIYNGPMQAARACATISDATTGDLLFYTNGIQVFNHEHQIMQNGTDLGACTAVNYSTQGVLIVPKPNSQQYYIVLATCHLLSGYKELRYYTVDIAANMGLGTVIESNPTLLYNDVMENVTAYPHANGTDYWLISHAVATNEFLVFLVTQTGIQAPTAYNVGTAYQDINTFLTGYMKFSGDGSQLAFAPFEAIPIDGTDNLFIEIFDFDTSTGALQLQTQIPANGFEYGVGFSPDNTKLYISTSDEENYEGYLFQYDLEGDNIAATKDTLYYSTERFGAIQKGRDNKLYVPTFSGYLGVIHYPNCPGKWATYEHQGVPLSAGAFYSLPNFIEQDYPDTILTLAIDFTFEGNCVEQPVLLAAIANQPVDEWIWLIGDTMITDTNFMVDTVSNLTVDFEENGLHEIKLIARTNCQWDTIAHTIELLPSIEDVLAQQALLCQNEETLLEAIGEPSYSYEWSTGGSGKSIMADSPGIYTVTVTNGGCIRVENIEVIQAPSFVIDLGNDTTMCGRNDLVLDIGAGFDHADILWCTGETTRSITVNEAGNYWVAVTHNHCTKTDEINLHIIPEPSKDLLIPTAFSPNGDGVNDCFRPVGTPYEGYELHIFNRWGNPVFYSQSMDDCWDGRHNFQAQPMSMYAYKLRTFDCQGRAVIKAGNVTLIR